MPTWDIYHCDREYAKWLNDPLIGTVSASTKEQAERIAAQQYNLPTGAWAVEQPGQFAQLAGAAARNSDQFWQLPGQPSLATPEAKIERSETRDQAQNQAQNLDPFSMSR
jgi:hypothetical protein